MKRMKRLISAMFHGLGTRHLFVVHGVVGDRHLREVVEQVVGQHLDRRHGQKRQEGAGPQNAEHVAEVRARPHANVFQNVREYLAALNHAPFQNRQILFEQDQICRFLGDICSRVNRDADVGSLQRGCVVDSVSQKSDYVSLALSARMTLSLCAGERRAKSVVFSAASPSSSSDSFSRLLPAASARPPGRHLCTPCG